MLIIASHTAVGEPPGWWYAVAAAYLIFLLACVVVTPLKGKWGLFLVGFLIHWCWIFGAIRLAKPRSFWARKFYEPEKIARAVARFGGSVPELSRVSHRPSKACPDPPGWVVADQEPDGADNGEVDLPLDRLDLDAEPSKAAVEARDSAAALWSAGSPWKAIETLNSGTIIAWNDLDYAGLVLLAEHALAIRVENIGLLNAHRRLLEAAERDARVYAQRIQDSATRSASASNLDRAEVGEPEGNRAMIDRAALAATDPPGSLHATPVPDPENGQPIAAGPESAAPDDPGDAAMLILRERLARGEIAIEEFRALRDALRET